MVKEKHDEASMSAHLSEEHKTVLEGLRKLEEFIDRSELEKTAEMLNVIKEGMDAHFREEEEILFPVLSPHFEKAAELIGGDVRPSSPVRVMLLEHSALRTLMQNLEEALKIGKKDEAMRVTEQFKAFVKSHIFREENVLYVVADAKLSEKERKKALEEMWTLTKKPKK